MFIFFIDEAISFHCDLFMILMGFNVNGLVLREWMKAFLILLELTSEERKTLLMNKFESVGCAQILQSTIDYQELTAAWEVNGNDTNDLNRTSWRTINL
jgi:hypothetical protein